MLKNILGQVMLNGTSSFVNIDAVSGIGAYTMNTSVSTWKGRVSRYGGISVQKDNGQTKIVRVIQTGINITDIIPSVLVFDSIGGKRTVTVSTNTDTLTAVISSISSSFPKAVIESMNYDGMTIEVEGTELEYGIPGDPGAQGVFTVQFVMRMPPNISNDVVNELLTINGKQIKIVQQAGYVPYIIFDTDTVTVPGDAGAGSVNITSNCSYDIEIVQCDMSEGGLEVFPSPIILGPDGSVKQMNVASGSSYTIK